MKKKRNLFLLLLILIPPVSIIAGEFDIGFAVQGQAGLSPLLFINEDGVGLRMKYRFSDLFSLEGTTAAGYSFLFINYNQQHWFHVSQEAGARFNLALGSAGAFDHYLSAGPSAYLSFSPWCYLLYGPGLNIGYVIRNREKGFVIEPVDIFIRALLRDTDLSYKWHFQAGIRFSLLWEVSE